MKDMCLDEKYDVDEGDECQKMSVDKRYEREEIYECEWKKWVWFRFLD